MKLNWDLYRLVRGGGVKGQIPFLGGMDIFWNYKIQFLLLLMFWNHGLISLYFQANQAGSSSGMEFLGFKEAFTFLLGTGMIIKSFVSDRHTSIAKWMREDCPKKCEELGKPVAQHFFDIWHIGKSKLFYTMNNHNFTNEPVKTNLTKISSITTPTAYGPK